MNIMSGRIAAAATTLVLAAGGVGLTASSASADEVIRLTTNHSAGIYNQPFTTSGKVTSEAVTPGMQIDIACWTTGQTINNLGDVWYQITAVNWDIFGWSPIHGYVYGAYVDNNAAFHAGNLGHC